MLPDNIEVLNKNIWDNFIPDISQMYNYNMTNSSTANIEYFTNGLNFAIIKDNDILAIIGASYTIENTVELSILLGINFKKNLRFCIKKINEVLSVCTPVHITRYEGHVELENTTDLRFATYFGFNIVGIRHSLGPDKKDYVLVEKILQKGN